MAIVLTERAVQEVNNVKEAQGLGEETFLRIIIVGGGCSGMRYSLGFDTVFEPLLDTRYEYGNVSLITQKKYDLFLDGTQIDFIDTPMSKGFSIDNPNFPAGAGCAGCGGH
ncbi:MAG: iron-sulfur cluster assembly accessory protein [Planctomycetia bacterium]|nr:iron-sulfur cluster assembly accessory protein [Planctomycetia bacterium]